MNDQNRALKLLYTLFLLTVTVSAALSIYDRFSCSQDKYDRTNNK